MTSHRPRANDDEGKAIPPSQLPTLSAEADLTARKHFEIAYRDQKEGRLDKAVAGYEKAISAKVMFESYFNLGLCHRERGSLNEAESAFARAAKLNKLYRPIYKQLSEVQRELGKDSEAEVSWSQYSQL